MITKNGAPNPKVVKKDRNRKLTELGNRKALHFRRQFLNKTVSVLVENRSDPVSGVFKGHSENFIPVTIVDGKSFFNKVVPVTIEQVSEWQVSGCVLL